LKMVLCKGLQSCRCITLNVINVIKMPSFQYFLYFREQKKVISYLQTGNSLSYTFSYPAERT
jgi:hypothetical protein